MSKVLALLGLILIIVGFIPLLLPMVGLGAYAAYFDLGIYSLNLAGYVFTEVMLALIGLGVILLIVGAIR
ncbi:MAG: hypothetical protein ACFFDP_05215 [Promethearchaeota archaeon]